MGWWSLMLSVLVRKPPTRLVLFHHKPPKKKTKLGFQAGGVRSNCKHVILKGNAVWFVIRRGYSAKGYAGRVLGDVRKQSICMMKSRVSSRTCYQTLHLSSSNSDKFSFSRTPGKFCSTPNISKLPRENLLGLPGALASTLSIPGSAAASRMGSRMSSRGSTRSRASFAPSGKEEAGLGMSPFSFSQVNQILCTHHGVRTTLRVFAQFYTKVLRVLIVCIAVLGTPQCPTMSVNHQRVELYIRMTGGATLINFRLVPGSASAVSFTSVYFAYVCM